MVVVILGIASAIVLPQINSHNDLNASAAARTVMADLLYAQNRAIAMQTVHYVTFDTTNQQYTLFSSMSPQRVLQHPIDLNNYVMTFGKSGPNNISQSSHSPRRASMARRPSPSMRRAFHIRTTRAQRRC